MDAALRTTKARFALLVKVTGEGTAADFARSMTRLGYDIDGATVKRWTKLDNPSSPNMSDLWVIHLVKPEISVDWLLGIRPPESTDEKWIEAQTVVQHEFARLGRLTKAAKLALVLFFVYGGAACVVRHIEIAENQTSWVQIVTKLTIANSVEPVDLAYVEETIAASMLPKWLEGGRVNKTGGGAKRPAGPSAPASISGYAASGSDVRWPRRPSVDLRLKGKWK